MKRANKAKLKELLAMASISGDPLGFFSQLRKRPNGGEWSIKGITFQVGKISYLKNEIASLTSEQILKFRWRIPKKFRGIERVVHLDSFRSKKTLEESLGLPIGLISGQKKKFDILIVCKSGVFVVSYKDNSEEAKLGQIMAKTSCGGFVLGGICLDSLTQFPVPKTISYKSTSINRDCFVGLTKKHQRLAYIKHNYPAQFQPIAAGLLRKLERQVRCFCDATVRNPRLCEDLIKNLLTGSQSVYKGAVVSVYNRCFSLEDFFKKFSKCKYSCTYKVENSLRRKKEFHLSLKMAKKTYNIATIVPAFDGFKPEVAQTKGPVAYFKQHRSDMHFWRLLSDVMVGDISS